MHRAWPSEPLLSCLVSRTHSRHSCTLLAFSLADSLTWTLRDSLCCLWQINQSQFLLGSREVGWGHPGDSFPPSLRCSLSPRVSWLSWACFGHGLVSFLMPYCAISQIYWLHMVYAAVGAICFTLVSLLPFLGRELRWWSLGSLGGGEEPWTTVLFLM